MRTVPKFRRKARRSSGWRKRVISSVCRIIKTGFWIYTKIILNLFNPIAAEMKSSNSLKAGLKDLSVSRTAFDWGVPVPDDPEHVIYVWMDALTNYLTVTGYPETDGDAYTAFWPAGLHIIGKDITRFHSVYWPAFLMSAGLPLPEQVFAHGFLTVKGEKMSKSLGNVLDPFVLAEHYGVDAVRYFFLREVPFGRDGSFSDTAIVNRVNADLANDLGNLAQRSLSMIAKNCGGEIPDAGEFTAEDNDLLAKADALGAATQAAMEKFEIHNYLALVFDVVSEANRYFAGAEPWALKKTDPARMGTVLYCAAEIVRQAAILDTARGARRGGKIAGLSGCRSGASRFFIFGWRASACAGHRVARAIGRFSPA